jgi:dihydrolipoamide dehydrogenase
VKNPGERFDLAVVGGGTGGYVAAIRAAQLGLKVALIERDKLGGTCLHRGCIPTKALLESAEVLNLVSRAQEYGILAEKPRFDYTRILRRKDSIVSRLHSGIEYLMKKNQITVIKGQGRLLSPTTVAVTPSEGGEGQEVIAQDLILATGSKPKDIPGLEIDGDHIITSDHLLGLTQVPGSLIIVGAGAVGAEFASLFNSLGSEVALVEMLPTIVPLEDREIGEELARQFARRGIKVLTGARVLPDTLRLSPGGVEIEVEKEGQRQTLRGERLLLAVGREGCVEGLGLEGLQVQVERGYVKVNENMATGEPHLYAIGDLIGGLLLAHVAMAEGIVAVESIAGQEVIPLDYNRVPRCTYCQPQIASLGLSEEAASAQGYKVKVGRFPFRANGRALIRGEADGFAKVVTDAESGEVLGVHILGPQATELIAEPALAKLMESTAWEIGASIHAHPTLAEVIGEASLAVDGRAIHI